MRCDAVRLGEPTATPRHLKAREVLDIRDGQVDIPKLLSCRRNSAPPPPKPRGGPSALAGRGASQSGSVSVTTHTLSLRAKSSAKCAMALLF